MHCKEHTHTASRRYEQDLSSHYDTPRTFIFYSIEKHRFRNDEDGQGLSAPNFTFMYNNVLRQCTRFLCRLPAYSHCLPRSIHVAQGDAFTSHDSMGLLLAINPSNDSGALWGGWTVLRNLDYCKYRAVAFREKQEYIAGVSREFSPVLNGNIYSKCMMLLFQDGTLSLIHI